MSDFEIPQGLCEQGKKAAETLLACVREHKGGRAPYGGGCRAFYTPDEWAARGEEYGLKSILVVVHDGGDMAPLLNWDYCEYEYIEQGIASLDAVGLYAEQCTTWYTAIYPRFDYPDPA